MHVPYIQKITGGWRLFVRLQPNARATKILGTWEDPAGQIYLKIAITTVPEKGKANKALIDFLSKHFHMPKTSFVLVRGETDRTKILEVIGEGLMLQGSEFTF